MITLPATTFGPEPPQIKPQPPRKEGGPAFARDERRSYASAAVNPFEAGTSWIGPLGGLSGSPDNAQGFVDELAADGWLINFNWGDLNAWESDWRRNDVFDRWDGAFDGLHTLMGYGAVTFDTTEEGGRLVRYAKDGMPLIDAWMRTGQEIQPSTNGWGAPFGPTVWVGAMYVATAGADPRFDHLWGHGSVSSDPRNPTSYVAMWTTC